MNIGDTGASPCHGIECKECDDEINVVGSFLRWRKMHFCNRTCVTVYLMDNARECTECKVRIRPDLLGNRSHRTGNGTSISHFCSVDCITQYNHNSKCDFGDTAGWSSLDSGSFHDVWNDIFKNGEYNLVSQACKLDYIYIKYLLQYSRKKKEIPGVFIIEMTLIFSYRFVARCAVRHMPKTFRLRLRRRDHHPSERQHDFLLLECMHDGRLRFLQASETHVGNVRDSQCR